MLQNLDYDVNKREYKWRIPIRYLADNLDHIHDDPAVRGPSNFQGPVLFISGAKSSYLSKEKHPSVIASYPKAKIETIENAGHYPHFEQQQTFLRILEDFVDENL